MREEPYINHLAEVAQLLADATDGDDLDLVLAGLLHDTIEDTETTYDELVTEFGAVVADLVAEVTDDKKLEKAERKRRQVETAPYKSDRARWSWPGSATSGRGGSPRSVPHWFRATRSCPVRL